MAYFLGLPTNDRLTLGVEVGIQNTSLAFLIASKWLNNEDMLKPALVYAMFTFFTAMIYGLVLKPNEGKLFWQRMNNLYQNLAKH
ncbi:MAG: hypothetical protein IPN33_13855 [Saprospiraceae bacterium]|nr:hypothetical protein [Saprospiraceae bacterium]